MGTAALRRLGGKPAAEKKPQGFWTRPGAPKRSHKKKPEGNAPTAKGVGAAVPAPGVAARAPGGGPPPRTEDVARPGPGGGAMPPVEAPEAPVEASEATKAMLGKSFLGGLLEDAYAIPYEVWAEAVEVPEIVPSAQRRARVVAGVVEIMRANPREWMKWAPAVAILVVVGGDVHHGFQAMKEAKKKREKGARGAPPPAEGDHPPARKDSQPAAAGAPAGK